MMLALMKGRYTARLAEGPEDCARAGALRYQCFVAARGLGDDPAGQDHDAFDAGCLQMLVEEAGSGELACTYRLMPLARGADVQRSYAAQFYDLAGLSALDAPLMELGRFCVAPGRPMDTDLLRVAWGAMARLVDVHGVQMLFGCSSFDGADAGLHHDALAALGRHVGPDELRPARKGDVVALPHGGFDARRALTQTPALLRTYLAMGGWVSDHAVQDHALNTLHVFTALPIANIPAARARALRAVAV
jgi:L-ornithine Nalpha-acyltransferase